MSQSSRRHHCQTAPTHRHEPHQNIGNGKKVEGGCKLLFSHTICCVVTAIVTIINRQFLNLSEYQILFQMAYKESDQLGNKCSLFSAIIVEFQIFHIFDKLESLKMFIKLYKFNLSTVNK